MLLSRKTIIQLNETQANIVGHMNYAASKLWNVCNYERRNYRELELNQYPDWYYQKKAHKDDLWFKSLPSQTAQEVCKQLDKAWKSYRHEDGEYCFGGGWFIVGIDTPNGSYTYHYENKYWDMFDCVDLPRAKHWDGHTEADAETRLLSLAPEPKVIHCKDCEWWTKQDKSLQGRCELMQMYPTGEWFCGNAQKKVEDESRVQ